MRTVFRYLVALLAVIVVAGLMFAGVVYAYNKYYVEYDYSVVGWPDESTFEPGLTWQPEQPDRVRILSVSGGALFGLADLEILMEIEKRSGKQIYELFDFFAGASTGAIVSTLLLFPLDDTGRPMTVARAAKAYETLSSEVFAVSDLHRILTVNGLFGPRFKNDARLHLAEQRFGDATFNDLLRPAMFPSYSSREKGFKLFKNWDEKEANIFLSALVSAVTSAPVFFPSLRLIGGANGDDFISDAALILNAPGEIGYLHARINVPEAHEFIVVMLNTNQVMNLSDATSVYGGLLEWEFPMLEMAFRGEASVSVHALERHADFESTVDVKTVVMAPEIPADIGAFDASPENVATIRRLGQDFVRENSDLIDETVALLTQTDKAPKNAAAPEPTP